MILERIIDLRAPLDDRFKSYRNITSVSWMLKNNYQSLLKDKLENNQLLIINHYTNDQQPNDIESVCKMIKDKSLFDLFYQRYQDHFYDDSVLEWACHGGNIDIVKMLIDQQEPIKLYGDLDILMGAMKSNNIELVKYLYENVDCCRIDKLCKPFKQKKPSELWYDNIFETLVERWLKGLPLDVDLTILDYIMKKALKERLFDQLPDIVLINNLDFITKYNHVFGPSFMFKRLESMVDAYILVDVLEDSNTMIGGMVVDQSMISQIIEYVADSALNREDKKYELVVGNLDDIRPKVQELMLEDQNHDQRVYNLLLFIGVYYRQFRNFYNRDHQPWIGRVTLTLVKCGVASTNIFNYIQGLLLEKDPSPVTYQQLTSYPRCESLINSSSLRSAKFLLELKEEITLDDVTQTFNRGDMELLKYALQRFELPNKTLKFGGQFYNYNVDTLEEFYKLGYTLDVSGWDLEGLLKDGWIKLALLNIKQVGESRDEQLAINAIYHHSFKSIHLDPALAEYIKDKTPQFPICSMDWDTIGKSATPSFFANLINHCQTPSKESKKSIEPLFSHGRDDLLLIYFSRFPLVPQNFSPQYLILNGYTRVLDMFKKDYPHILDMGSSFEYAIERGHIHVVKYLVDHFNESYRQNKGKDIRHYLEERGSLAFAKGYVHMMLYIHSQGYLSYPPITESSRVSMTRLMTKIRIWDDRDLKKDKK